MSVCVRHMRCMSTFCNISICWRIHSHTHTHAHECRGRQEYIGYVHVCGYIRPHMCAAGLVEVSTLAGRARDVQGQQEGEEEKEAKEKRKEREGV